MTEIQDKYKNIQYLLFKDDMHWKLINRDVGILEINKDNIKIYGQIHSTKIFESENSQFVLNSVDNDWFTIDDHTDRKLIVLTDGQYALKLDKFIKILIESKTKINKLKNGI